MELSGMDTLFDALVALEDQVLSAEAARREEGDEYPKLQDVIRLECPEADVARALMHLWGAYEELAATQPPRDDLHIKLPLTALSVPYSSSGETFARELFRAK